jgi:hypothetical protein
MKKALIVTVTALGLVGSFSLYTSCKKGNSLGETHDTTSPSKGFSKRITGTEIYYSRDLETNTSYQLTITTNANNEITIHREININSPELDSMKTHYGFDEDVNYTITPEKVVRIDPPVTGNTYFIPFKPDRDVVNYVYGGESSATEFYCTCELAIASSPSCQADLERLKNGALLAHCIAKNCQTCKLRARKYTKKKVKGEKMVVVEDLNTNAGFIVINGTAIHEI